MREWTCSTCGESHRDAPRVWSVPLPDIIAALPPAERDRRVVNDGPFLALDGEHVFVQGAIEIPVRDGGPPLSYLAGSSISRTNHHLWRSAPVGSCEALGPFFGWLSNSLPGYPSTLNLKLNVHPRGATPPYLELEPTDHPLAVSQREGLLPGDVLEIAGRLLHEGAPAPRR